MKRTLLLLASGVWLLASLPSPAIIDTNNNGVSDLWEQQYNSQQLFDETFDPQADPDGDGWTNAQEAAAGTDPFNPNPPDGIIRPDIVRTPAVMGEENGEPVVITPEVVTVSWPTIVGKQYTLLASPDLSEGSWVTVGDSFIGTGSIPEFHFETHPADKCFWRVAVTDIDTDDDGLTDAEEYELDSNPRLADSDGDGLPDDWEIANGLSPNDDGSINPNNGPAGDADGDGVSNIRELQAGTKANDPNDFPEELSHVFNRVHGGSHYSSSTDSHAGTVTFIPWDQSVKADKSITTELSPATMVQELAELNTEKLPATFIPAAIILASPQNVSGSNLADPGCEASAVASIVHSTSQFGNATTGGQYSSTRCWVHAPPKPVAREYHFFRYKSHTRIKEGEPDTTEITEPAIVTLTIPVNQTYSEPVDLTTTTTYETDTQHITTVNLRHISIIPDDNMVGVVGDTVMSNKGINGEKHFVTPKKAGQFVNLKAAGIEAEQFGQLFEWECDETKGEQGTASNKYKVKRDNAEPIVLKIKAKAGGAVVAKLNVWMVWSEGSKVGTHPISSGTAQIRTGDGTIGAGTKISGGYDFKFVIQPATIITADDHPDLSGPNKYGENIVDPPGSGSLHVVTGVDLKNGVDLKWDVSRRIRSKIINPNLYSKPKLDKVAGTYWDNQPLPEDQPAVFPSDICIGNDDSDSLGDEENNPYKAFEFPKFSHEIGEITSSDQPKSLMINSAGADGDTYEEHLHYGEFTRLLIGSKWYSTSEMFNWRVHMKFKRQSGLWSDDHSTIETDNENY